LLASTPSSSNPDNPSTPAESTPWRRLYTIETQRTTRDGSLEEVRMTAAPLRDSKGDIAQILVLFEDITERKRAIRR
jgi:PAS domain S-box-containing protein